MGLRFVDEPERRLMRQEWDGDQLRALCSQRLRYRQLTR